jgi:hypothetical protein
MREDKKTKGRRLLVEGRLQIGLVDDQMIVAACRGDSGTIYNLGWDHDDWYCNCEARTECSHLVALKLVTVSPVTLLQRMAALRTHPEVAA